MANGNPSLVIVNLLHALPSQGQAQGLQEPCQNPSPQEPAKVHGVFQCLAANHYPWTWLGENFHSSTKCLGQNPLFAEDKMTLLQHCSSEQRQRQRQHGHPVLIMMTVARFQGSAPSSCFTDSYSAAGAWVNSCIDSTCVSDNGPQGPDTSHQADDAGVNSLPS